MTPRIDKAVVSGVFSLDGSDFDVDNNVWLVGNDDEVLVIDAPHDSVGFSVGGTTLQALHTPGHSPGSTCLQEPGLGTVFTGDTLFCGGPGATGRSHSEGPTILASIRTLLLTLPRETVVRTGHGEDTAIAAESSHME